MKPLTERVAYHSIKGRRASNQDAVVVGILADGRSVAAVADGMGGRLAGDVASRRALEVMVEHLGKGGDLASAVEAANRAVFSESNADPDLHGMGTTVVVMLQEDDRYHIANVGDSRAYRLASEGISKVTADHSFTAEAVEAGEMTPEDAVLSPWANALTRAIGTDPQVDVDVFGPFDANESHAILLCSDGFHKPLSDDGILISVLGSDGEDAAEELTEIALRAGSDDNITIALVSFGDRSWKDRAIQSRNDVWDLEDAPTVEFEQDEALEGEEEAETEASADESVTPDDDDADVEREPTVWVFPDSTDGEAEHQGDEDGLIEAGYISEGMTRVRGDAEVSAAPDDGGTAVGVASDETESAVVEAPSEGDTERAASEPAVADTIPALAADVPSVSIDEEAPAGPVRERRRHRRSGFSLAVRPDQRRLNGRGKSKALLSVALLTVTALVVLAILQLL